VSLYEFGPFRIDASRLLLLDRDAPIPLGPKVVETLLALVEHPGEIVPKGDLLTRIWPEGYVDEANLAQNIYVLRKTLRSRWNVEAIETVPRRGYRFKGAVQRREVAQLAPAARRALPWASLLQRRGAVAAAVLFMVLVGGSALSRTVPTGAPAGVRSGEAGRLYAMGRYYWNLRTREGVAKSMEYFARVVADDPADSRGYAGLASANAIEADYEYGKLPAKAYVARARTYAQRALQLDPNSSEAYAVLGLISSKAMKGAVAAPQTGLGLSYLRRAIALDPASASAHEWYGMSLFEQGHVQQAYFELSKAAQLEPTSVSTTAWLGTTAYLQGHYGDAIAYARETLDLSPQRDDAYVTEGLAYQALGDEVRAAASFRSLGKICTDCQAESAALLAALYAHERQMDRARAQLAIAQAHTSDVAPQDLALALAAVGQRGAALTWLHRWRTGNYHAATKLANDPRFAGLRAAERERAQKPA
jgi:DNA-binding winged helix-turn-helix (wHTH) protein/Flp pilus assembly protein TadD